MTNPSYPQRKSPRLKGYDYSLSGAYFVTICTENRLNHFGKILENNMCLSELGQIACQELAALPRYWQNLDMDLFIIMPNHVHAIVVLHEGSSSKTSLPKLGDIVGGYKAAVTRVGRKAKLITKNLVLWQERYHDHIIRHEKSLNYIRNYVATNPERWAEDYFYEES